MPFSSRPAFAKALASFLPALLLGCAGGSTADAEAVRAIVAREVAATNAKDLKALGEIWSQNKGILLFDVPPPGRFQGWDKVGRLFKDFFERFSEIHLKVDNVQVEASGGMAYATYDWTMTGRMGDYAVDDRGEATAVYRKEDGGWRLVHAHYSSAPPAPADHPAAPEATPGARPPTPAPSPGGSPPGR